MWCWVTAIFDSESGHLLKTIALFGGTFDPVHNGHLRSAQELKQRLALDELRLLPCHRPPHRESPRCSSEHRLAMVELAAVGSGLLVDDREIKLDGISYSVETLAQLRSELGSQVSLLWVMGSDAFTHLDQWHRWRELLDFAHLVIMMRPDAELPKAGVLLEMLHRYKIDDARMLSQRAAGCIYIVQLTPYPVSATAIRRAIAVREPVADYLPLSVQDYIERYQLYY
jgi:nicotinate-nucleotide adenylyltransferase